MINWHKRFSIFIFVFLLAVLIFSLVLSRKTINDGSATDNAMDKNSSIESQTSQKHVFGVYGQNFKLDFPLPKYWYVNMDFAHANMVDAFFYIKDVGINASPVAIITELYPKSEKNSSLSDFIEEDKNYLLNNYHGFSFVGTEYEIVNEYGFQIEVFEFSEGTSGHLQYIAYVDCNTNYFIKESLSIIDRDSYDQYLIDFIEGLEGMSYLNIELKEEYGKSTDSFRFID
ncbi:hypothetical protein KKA33_03515 [Patescibacteria group bacterium]|nr:hypothetical protein [Patescibacteria group bacterium]